MIRHDSDLDQAKLDQALERLPAQFFRYMSLQGERKNWLKQVVLESKLYFCSSKDFNDPLDCHISPDFSGSPLQIEQFWRRYFRRQFPNAKLSEHKQHIREMTQDSIIPERQQRLIASTMSSMEKHGIVSFSTDPTNTLMWAYYADGHRGVCLEFSMKPEYLVQIPGKVYPLEVKYQTDFPRISYYHSETLDFVSTMFGVKAKAWQHEKEWRLISPGYIGHKSFPSQMLQGVILGSRASSESEKFVKELLVQRTPPIRLRRIEHKKNSFLLECVDLD